MKIQNITEIDMSNGMGIRTVLWVSGCSHKCKGCHNPQTWDPDSGVDYNEEIEIMLFDALSASFIKGITFSGGDPLYPGNRDAVGQIIEKVHNNFPNKDIWLYTGYLWEEIKDLPYIKYVNVLVDGEFHINEKDPLLPFAGSRNQRVINVTKTLEEGQIILYC